MKITGGSFLVTGAASGLGFATAESLVREGGRVTLVDLPTSKGPEAAAGLGLAACFAPADVTDEAQVQAAVTAAQQHGGGLHGAICCAGVALGERLVGKHGPHRLSSFESLLAVNVVGTFNVFRIAAARMMEGDPNEEGECGVLISTASVAAFEGQVGQVAYAASKGAVAAMTLPVAREMAAFGIRCVSIAPGIFDTAMMAGMSDAVRASLAAQVPFPPRLGQPAEYAALVRHVLQNVMLNGTVIRLDGALHMGAK